MTNRVCSWCWTDLTTGKKLTEEEYHESTKADANVTHTICNRCLQKQTIKIEHQSMENASDSLLRKD